ncbi:glycine cleavage system aminomethyltransferase GcvT [Chryseobacterium sp. Ch-15]|uniref:Aminomethyltransferase n=1 Tax=Chryseobacterium muglaense TaxID=2893752 RepID=A0A9Q3UZH0_9FLAO|nr:glycine cleavage system aminomethyltransferase GcvT [Chryseobacterium muglaense]MBD3906445.1 glycine cleavage system aminomethyltransferase GcvT [Chryseobacterium muglaense]MCC9036843.1 glycine cleavage system aminomethyltransferase GcvT [Chryseobacterium muglaense]MCM2556169.1 glycine cleavage system aminomethyltransferase GcvT [Chryseobacterium muglaense]
MKKTAFNAIHHILGAKMVEYSGYEMPVQYKGINYEHETVRNNVGVFDVSHMGEISVKGKGSLELIQKITSNDASKLTPGKVQYSCMPNDTGGIIDDLLVYKISKNDYLLVVNASNIQKDFDWIKSCNSFGAEVSNISDSVSLLAVQGPKSVEVLQKLTDINVREMDSYTFTIGELAHIPNALISATGYTGELGFEIYVENKYAAHLWDAIFEAGKNEGIEPVGLAARDTLRLEMGYCLYGNDIDDFTSPLEAGLGWVTKFTKDFIHSGFLKIQKEKGTTKKLVGFEIKGKGIPRHHYEVLDENNQIIGSVTSGTMSPTLKKAIGMGYVSIENAKIGSEIFVNIRNRPVKAVIVKTPFIK